MCSSRCKFCHAGFTVLTLLLIYCTLLIDVVPIAQMKLSNKIMAMSSNVLDTLLMLMWPMDTLLIVMTSCLMTILTTMMSRLLMTRTWWTRVVVEEISTMTVTMTLCFKRSCRPSRIISFLSRKTCHTLYIS